MKRLLLAPIAAVAAVIAVAAVLLAGGGAASADAGEPSAPIQALDAALLTAMKSGRQAGFAAREAALAPAIDAAFDLPGILRGTVGPRWAALPAAQQQALLTAFRSFTLASYAGNFDSYDGQTIVIVPPPRAVGADQVVQTHIVSGAKTDRIDYQMRQVDGAKVDGGQVGSVWKAEDVLLDGSISNVAVQRSDFRRLLAAGDATRLIVSLNQRAADLASGSAQ